MFRIKVSRGHVMTIERHLGWYTVKARSGITIMASHTYNTGREAWKAFRMSPERFISE